MIAKRTYTLPKALFSGNIMWLVVELATDEYTWIPARANNLTIDDLCWPDGFWVEFKDTDGNEWTYSEGDNEEVVGVYADKETAVKVADLLNADNPDEAYSFPILVNNQVETVEYPVLIHQHFIQFERNRRFGTGNIIAAFVGIRLKRGRQQFKISYTVLPSAIDAERGDLIGINHKNIVS